MSEVAKFKGKHVLIANGRQKADRPYNSALEKGMDGSEVARYFTERQILD